MIRPQPARWFEILAARDDATQVLEALAATGAVELEAADPAQPLTAMLADVQPLLARFAELAQRYRAYWPEAPHPPSPFPDPPAVALGAALARLQSFAEDAEPRIAALQRVDRERRTLDAWSRALAAMHGSPLELASVAKAGPVLDARLVTTPAGTALDVPADVLVRPLATKDSSCALVFGQRAAIREATVRASAAKGGAYEAPTWLADDTATTAQRIAARREELDREEAELQVGIESLHRRHDVARALGDAERLQWVMQNVRTLSSGDLFCRVTGWASDRSGGTLHEAIDRCGARALLHFPPQPAGVRAPLLLENPPWVRPFELFARALGMPARDEVDPSALLAVAVPLMFGYMFGDVGQGLVIAAGGALLARRYPIARLFVAGGLSAAVFGLLFGSVFSVHGAVPVIWVDPLARPLVVLFVPIVGGAVMMTGGLLLNALAARWRGELGVWLLTDASFIVAYVAVLAAPWTPVALWIAGGAVLLFALGHALHARRASAALPAIAELAERLAQILINTLSFARVGAFALAHAGLSSAIVALMDAAESGFAKAAVLVAGNVVVIVLETLVVSIQTTRLVLFEFFTRFLSAAGRTFRPLPPPPSAGTRAAPLQPLREVVP